MLIDELTQKVFLGLCLLDELAHIALSPVVLLGYLSLVRLTNNDLVDDFDLVIKRERLPLLELALLLLGLDVLLGHG